MSEELLATIREAHREVFDLLLEATDGLDEGDWARSTGCPGWDVHDQLAHCVGLERRMLGDPPPEVAVPELPHVTDDLSRLVEADVQSRRGVAGDALREEARETFSRRLKALSRVAPESLAEPMEGPLGNSAKASTMLRIRVFDLVAHEQDIRRALGRDREPDGAHGQLVAAQVLRGLTALWPQRLAGHGAVEVEIAGPQADAARVELGDGEGVDGARVARLRGSLGELLALACGRSDAPDVARLHVDGDPDLAAEAVAAAPMTP